MVFSSLFSLSLLSLASNAAASVPSEWASQPSGNSHIEARDTFEGFTVYDAKFIDTLHVDETCAVALGGRVVCHGLVESFQVEDYRRSLGDVALTDLVCARECKDSMKAWINAVEEKCHGLEVRRGTATAPARFMLSGIEETCLKDQETEKYCNDVILGFTKVPSIRDMPIAELCSYCHVERLAMMQRNSFSFYDEFWKSQLEYVLTRCNREGKTDIPPPAFRRPEKKDECPFDKWFVVPNKMTCDDVAGLKNVSSAGVFMLNNMRIHTCGADDPLEAGTKLCLPWSCSRTYRMASDDTCRLIERNQTNAIELGDVRRYNPWVGFECRDLDSTRHVYGNTICLGPEASEFLSPPLPPTPPRIHPSILPEDYANDTSPLAPGTPVASETTLKCGQQNDTCDTARANSRKSELFLNEPTRPARPLYEVVENGGTRVRWRRRQLGDAWRQLRRFVGPRLVAETAGSHEQALSARQPNQWGIFCCGHSPTGP